MAHTALALLLAAWLGTGTAALAGPDYGPVQGVVVRVCDGDTVVVDIPEYPDIIGKSIRIRLIGVDAPELRDRDPAVRQAAQAARQAMEALLPPGTAVTLSRIRRDKYFRLDAAVSVDGRDAATVLGLHPRP
ncbi:MAG: thermonuclease family protein [Acidobacteriota bacterium]